MKNTSTIGICASIWGIGGVALILGSAVYRLSFIAADALSYHLLWYHKLSLLIVVLFMAYTEGFRAFQQGFSPRVAARSRYLSLNPRLTHVLLAPLFCMGFFHATRRRRITSLSVTIGIIILVVLVSLLPQPWRGIIDAGVIVGLVWGIVSLLIFGVIAFRSDSFNFHPDIPER